MSRLFELINQLEEAALHPKKTTIKSIKDTGREAIGCFPIHTPEELVYAAGYLPIGMWGGKTEIRLADKYLQGFCCSIMRANIEYGMNGTYDMLKAIILPTFCDTLKCICENWKVAVPHIPIMPMVYPQNRMIEPGIVYMREELLRVKAEIEKLAGKQITESELESAFEIYDEYRKTMREFTEVVSDFPVTVNSKARHLIIKAGYFMDKKVYTGKIREILSELKKLEKDKFDGKKVIMTGLIGEPHEILELFNENNIAIVGDDFAQESRQFRTISRDSGSVIDKMVYRVADQRGDTFFYEEQKSKGEMLINMVKEKNADGVVVWMMKFCDPEEFDFPIIKSEIEAAGIPLLYLEIEQQMDSFEQVRTRIQSFAEMID